MFYMLILSMSIATATEMKLIYDANGNLVTGDGEYRIYNSLNQLWKVYNGSNSSGYLMQEYIYHPIEERILVKKTYNSTGALIETVYYSNQNFVQIKNLSGTYNFTYIYNEGQLVAQLNPDGTKIFIHGDMKGSNSVVTNSTGKIIENSSYSPYGEVLSGGKLSRYNYEGKESDSVVGDTDFSARKYLPQYGIFEQPDTVISNVYDPQQLNRYGFERNNPYYTIDPTGHKPTYIIDTVLRIFIGVFLKSGFDKDMTTDQAYFALFQGAVDEYSGQLIEKFISKDLARSIPYLGEFNDQMPIFGQASLGCYGSDCLSFFTSKDRYGNFITVAYDNQHNSAENNLYHNILESQIHNPSIANPSTDKFSIRNKYSGIKLGTDFSFSDIKALDTGSVVHKDKSSFSEMEIGQNKLLVKVTSIG